MREKRRVLSMKSMRRAASINMKSWTSNFTTESYVSGKQIALILLFTIPKRLILGSDIVLITLHTVQTSSVSIKLEIAILVSSLSQTFLLGLLIVSHSVKAREMARDSLMR